MSLNGKKLIYAQIFTVPLQKSLKNLHDILLIPDPFNGTLLPVALLLTTTEVDCDVASEFGDVTGRKDVFMLANTVSRCFGSKYCCIIAR